MITVNKEKYGLILRQLVGCSYSVVLGEKIRSIVGMEERDINMIRDWYDGKTWDLTIGVAELERYLKLCRIALDWPGKDESWLIASVDYEDWIKAIAELEAMLIEEKSGE